MKKSMFFVVLLMLLIGMFNVYADLQVTATTSTNNGRYSPRNVITMWIQDSNGGFVKNIYAECAIRTRYLYTWVSRSGWTTADPWTDIDGWTGATRRSHGTMTATWDLTDQNGQPVPFGTYEFWVEYTEEHAQGPIAHGTIVIGNQDQTETVTSSYIDITAVYTAEVVTPTPTPTSTITPTPTPTATPFNLALNKPIFSSNDYSPAFSAKNANDGDMTTVWGSSVANPTDWIYVDLEAEHRVNHVVINWFGDYYPKKYSIYISKDLKNWTKVATINKNTQSINNLYSPDAVYIRGFALLCEEKNMAAYGLAELEIDVIEADPTPTATPTPTITPTPTSVGGCPQWVQPKPYTYGDCATYNGVQYTCIQDHTSQTAWDPVTTLGILWQAK